MSATGPYGQLRRNINPAAEPIADSRKPGKIEQEAAAAKDLPQMSRGQQLAVIPDMMKSSGT